MAYHYLCPVSFVHTPETAEELAEQLQRAARHDRTITLNGAGSKCRMAGPILPSDETITTVRLSKLLKYEPNDLTVSVQAGMPWRDFCAILAENRQIVPLDPPFVRSATVGGVIACNQSGPRRLHYGSARDV